MILRQIGPGTCLGTMARRQSAKPPDDRRARRGSGSHSLETWNPCPAASACDAYDCRSSHFCSLRQLRHPSSSTKPNPWIQNIFKHVQNKSE